jgi:hypothetical protein
MAKAKRSARSAVAPEDLMIHAIIGPYRGTVIYAGEDFDQCIAEGWAIKAFTDEPTDEIPNIDERVELATTMAAKWAENGGPEISGTEPPTPPEPATLTSIDPNTAVLNDPDFTLTCTGSGFTPASTIFFADQPEPIVYVSAEEITTIVKPSLPWGAVTVPVRVDDSEPLDFTFTETAPTSRTTSRTETAPKSRTETVPTSSRKR